MRLRLSTAIFRLTLKYGGIKPMSLVHAAQLRAARSMLRWEQEQLASAAGVSIDTVSRLERLSGELDARASTLRALQRALEAAGVEFKPDGSVRLRERPADVPTS